MNGRQELRIQLEDSSTASIFSPSWFIALLEDSRTEFIFLKNLLLILKSNHLNLHSCFDFCLSHKDERFREGVVIFLSEYFDKEKCLSLSVTLEKYLMRNIWNKEFLSLLQTINISPTQILATLGLKMRSLQRQIREESLSCLRDLVENVRGAGIVREVMFVDLKRILPQMIERERYGKEVCYYRGVLLQILEDEFCELKKKCLEFFGATFEYYEMRSIRPLILYMLNDEHLIVRKTALSILSSLQSLELQKEDLNALLVCLRQKDMGIRELSYLSICKVCIEEGEDLLLIISKIFEALLSYKEDKKRIYSTCAKLSRKHSKIVIENLSRIYKFSDCEEPSWKSLIYKARLILVACIQSSRWPDSLPRYFKNHYLYIRDVQLYAFKTLEEPKSTHVSKKHLTLNLSPIIVPSLLSTNFEQIRAICRAYLGIYSGFLKVFLEICLNVSDARRKKAKQQERWKKQNFSILRMMFNLEKQPLGEEIVKLGEQIEEKMRRVNYCIQEVMQLIRFCIKNEEKLILIKPNVFKTSSHHRSRIMITNNSHFISNALIQFSSGGSHKLRCSSQECLVDNDKYKYIRMREAEFEEQTEEYCYYQLDFKWKRIRLLIKLEDSQVIILDELTAM